MFLKINGLKSHSVIFVLKLTGLHKSAACNLTPNPTISLVKFLTFQDVPSSNVSFNVPGQRCHGGVAGQIKGEVSQSILKFKKPAKNR